MFKIKSLLFCCTFQLLFFCNISGEKLSRYVIETDLKPAIFGSYIYDMINGEFVIKNNNSTTEINLTDIIFNTTSSSSSIFDESYRKHVATRAAPTATETLKTFNWWTQARELFKNTTLYKQRINQNKTITLLSKSETINSQLNNTL